MKSVFLVFLLVFPFVSQAGFSSLGAQVSSLQSAAGNPRDNFQLAASSLFRGFRKPKAALKGVLYWGGVDGGDGRITTPMTNAGQMALCEAGFSRAFFVYGNPDKIVNCRGNSMAYSIVRQPNQAKPNSPNLYEFLQAVHLAATSDGAVGPVYMHCRYGVHASNTLAAIALRQFCGWSAAEAVEHWDRIGHIPDPQNKALSAAGKHENRQKIVNFVPYKDLLLPEEIKKTVCFRFN